MTPQTHARSGTALAVSGVLAMVLAVGIAHAQSASTSVRTIAGSNGDRRTPGVSSSTQSAASDSSSAQGVSVMANSLASPGVLSTFASGVGGTSFPFFVTGFSEANASFSDVMVIDAEGSVQDGLAFHFLLTATGEVSGSAPPQRTVVASSEFTSTYSVLGGAPTTTTGGMIAGVESILNPNRTTSYRSFQRDIGLGFGIIAVDIIWTRQAAGAGGLPVSLSFSSRSRIAFDAGGGFNNGSFDAVADFGHTLRWIGLDSVTNLDGTPFTGTFSVTSASGFDDTIPTPNAAVIMLLSCADEAGLSRQPTGSLARTHQDSTGGPSRWLPFPIRG
jgi:hypothetical protein